MERRKSHFARFSYRLSRLIIGEHLALFNAHLPKRYQQIVYKQIAFLIQKIFYCFEGYKEH